MFLLFVPYTIDSKATVFTKLGAALWAGMNDILEPIQYEWYPHTAVAPEKNISKSQFLASSKLNSRIKQNMACRICSLLVFTLDYGIFMFQVNCTGYLRRWKEARNYFKSAGPVTKKKCD